MSEIKKKVERKEPHQINFRVTETEHERLQEMANNLNISVPNFCKKTAQKKQMKSPKINREGALEIAKELRKIGTNVNQIAKKLNQNIGVETSKLELENVKQELKKIWQSLS